MTLREKVVLSAYTGILMCDFAYVHAYIEQTLGRPVWVHEIADPKVMEEIHEKAEKDFIAVIGADEGWGK